MKNTIWLFWIIVIVMVIGFSMSACDSNDENNDNKSTCTLTIVNDNYAYPITEVIVNVDDPLLHKENLSITTTQSFSIDLSKVGGATYFAIVRVYANGLDEIDSNTGKNYISTVESFVEDRNVTIYLTFKNEFNEWRLSSYK
jgi:hypothetical protein